MYKLLTGHRFIFDIHFFTICFLFPIAGRCMSSTWMFQEQFANKPSKPSHLYTCKANKKQNLETNVLYILHSTFPSGAPFDHISRYCAVDHQGAGADVPPKERLPIMCGAEGPILRLVCPRGQVRIAGAHTHTHSQMHACSDRVTQTPTRAIPSVEHSRVFVQRFTADTFSSRRCLYSISCCPCCREELKLFVSPMQRRQPVQFSLISLYLSGS